MKFCQGYSLVLYWLQSLDFLITRIYLNFVPVFNIIFFFIYTYLLLINNDLKDCFLLFGEKSCRGWSVPFHKYFKKISSKISYIQSDFFFRRNDHDFLFILIFKDFPSEIFCFDFRELKMWRLYKMPVIAETNQISNKN